MTVYKIERNAVKTTKQGQVSPVLVLRYQSILLKRVRKHAPTSEWKLVYTLNEYSNVWI